MTDIAPVEQRAARNEAVDSILRSLTALRGVMAAAVVDSDGLVTHIRRDFEVDTDALGASVQIVFGAASRAAEHVTQGNVHIVICENAEGFILLAPIKGGMILALFADRDAMLGAVRFEIKESIPELAQFF